MKTLAILAQKVAAVAADDVDTAEEALTLIEVEYAGAAGRLRPGRGDAAGGASRP